MSPVDTLLMELESFGATVRVHADRLRIEAPGDLPGALYRSLVEHRDAIVARLRAKPAVTTAAGTARAGMRGCDPWPEEVPGLGRRSIGPFAPCSNCGDEWTWVVYGSVYLCRPCAHDTRVIADGGTPSRRRSMALDW